MRGLLLLRRMRCNGGPISKYMSRPPYIPSDERIVLSNIHKICVCHSVSDICHLHLAIIHCNEFTKALSIFVTSLSVLFEIILQVEMNPLQPLLHFKLCLSVFSFLSLSVVKTVYESSAPIVCILFVRRPPHLEWIVITAPPFVRHTEFEWNPKLFVAPLPSKPSSLVITFITYIKLIQR